MSEDKRLQDLYDHALNEIYYLRALFAEEAIRSSNRGTRRGARFMQLARGEWYDLFKQDRGKNSQKRQDNLRAVGASPVLTNYQHSQEYDRNHREVVDDV